MKYISGMASETETRCASVHEWSAWFKTAGHAMSFPVIFLRVCGFDRVFLGTIKGKNKMCNMVG